MATNAGFVQLPTDSGNTGKKVRTRTRVVGSDTVHEHYFIESSEREYVGKYIAHSGVFTVQTAAHTFGTSGFFWFINPIGSSVLVAVSGIEVITQMGSALAAPTSPRLLFSRFTYTGTPSGATVTPGKLDSNMATPQASFRTALTGMSMSKDADMLGTLPTASATAVGYAPSMMDEWSPPESEQIILRAGEGLGFWQADAGTNADTRRIIVTMKWEEYT